MPFLTLTPHEVVSKQLPPTPRLGYPVPSHRHAVSVQLPTWDDMRGMVAQEPRVSRVQQIGYPRSFLNQDIVKVSQNHKVKLTIASFY
jgi:cystathionine gamma-synthase